jgi:DNA-directed RNA polymerase specialized sigma24 family protein
MANEGSVTRLIQGFRDGDEASFAGLHARYWPILVEIARRKLNGTPPRAADEEDVAQQAFWSFYRSVRAGHLPNLANRHELLAALTHVTACKAISQIERELGTLKRGKGRVRGESALDYLAGQSSMPPGLQQVAATVHLPDEEALLRDCYDHYINRLPESVREVARLHLAGLSNRETAEELDCVERTVERKLALLRSQWRTLAAEELA